MKELDPDRYFPPDPTTRAIAHILYDQVRGAPIVAEGTMQATAFLGDGSAAQLRDAFDAASVARLDIEQSPLDDMTPYEALRTAAWRGTVAPVYCPDEVIDPETPGFVDHLDRFGQLTNCDAYTWKGYLEAHGVRRDVFRLYGCRASVHRHPTARAEPLDTGEKIALFRKVCIGKANAAEAETFRANMLMEMATMSADDGFALHLHAGKGCAACVDLGGSSLKLSLPVEYRRPILPLLRSVEDTKKIEIVCFTSDVQDTGRDLAPLSLAFSSMKFGLSSGAAILPRKVKRYREEMAMSGALLRSAPIVCVADTIEDIRTRSDTLRRVDCAFLADLVASHELSLSEAGHIVAYWAGCD